MVALEATIKTLTGRAKEHDRRLVSEHDRKKQLGKQAQDESAPQGSSPSYGP